MKNFILALVIGVSASARQQQQQVVEENQWAVPNVSYECVARLFQDWARGEKGSIGAKTKPFLMNMRTASDLEFSAKDFMVDEGSTVKNMADTDLASSSIWVKLSGAGDHGVAIEIHLSTKPELLNKEIMILGEEFKDSVVPEIGASTRLWVGSREDIARNGPISASVDCKLKSLWR